MKFVFPLEVTLSHKSSLWESFLDYCIRFISIIFNSLHIVRQSIANCTMWNLTHACTPVRLIVDLIAGMICGGDKFDDSALLV
jgi:hypothetical protein